MKPGEMRSMALSDATEQLAQLRAELAKERAVVASGTRPENPGKIRQLRKTIARMLTIMRERELKGEKMPAAEQQPKAPEHRSLLHKAIRRKTSEKHENKKSVKAVKEKKKEVKGKK